MKMLLCTLGLFKLRLVAFRKQSQRRSYRLADHFRVSPAQRRISCLTSSLR